MAPSMRPWRLREAMTSRLISRPASLEISPLGDRLQISDGGQGEGLRPSEFGHVVPSEARGGADRRGEAGFGAERIAAGDEIEIAGAAAIGAEVILTLKPIEIPPVRLKLSSRWVLWQGLNLIRVEPVR
jgi:hypothetical protein